MFKHGEDGEKKKRLVSRSTGKSSILFFILHFLIAGRVYAVGGVCLSEGGLAFV